MQLRRRTDRLILLAALLCLGGAGAVYYALQHAQGLSLEGETDRILLAVLAVVMTLLALGLLIVLLRNLIKLLVERRRGVLGSRFHTKLVSIFFVLVLIPSVVLFYAAVRLIEQVNEALFADPVQEVTEQSKSIVDLYNKLMRSDCARSGARIAAEIGERGLLDADKASELSMRARTWLAEDGLDFVAIYPPSGTRPRFEAVAPARGAGREVPEEDLVKLREEFVRRALASREANDVLDRIGTGQQAQRASAIVPIRVRPAGDVIGAVAVGRYIPSDTAQKTARINKLYNDYRKNLKNQPGLKRLYIALFATLTLLVLFAATWTGFYLARQITGPIQAMVEGTQAIAAGNLEHRVTATAADELGFLIESFNRMTAELLSNRGAIETSRRDLEASNQELEERRSYIEQLLESVPAGVISLDAHGNVTTVNRAVYRVLGIRPDRTLSGLPAAEAFSGPDLLPLVHEIEDIPHGEAVSQVQEFQLTIEGRPVNLGASLSARRDTAGRFSGSLIVLEDLTPVIRAQKTAAWREVARRIAHEIKNPLTPIQLSAQRILKKFHEGAEDFPRIVEEGITTIVSEVGTLKLLVDEFSRFARMPAVTPVMTDPNAVVEAAVALHDGVHPGISIVRDLAPDPPRILLDAEQMKRALINLIDNAIAAMDGSGRITVTTRSIPAERILRIEITDDGPGISSEDKDRLFVPYFSTKKRGTGLGLAIVNRIVSDHNGFVRAEDNRPRGTKFVIDLPA